MEPTSKTYQNKTQDILAEHMRTIINGWQCAARILFWPLKTALSRGVRFEFDENDLKPDITYVVASNHQSQLDAFILLTCFSGAVFNRLKPFRAMTMNRYLMRGLVKYGAIHMGCYPAREHATLPYGLPFSADLVAAGQTVFICPEGNLSLPGELPARPGIATLAKISNVRIIPAHIQWTRYGRWRRSFQLTYGKPFNGAHMSAQQILDYCYDLPLGKRL